MFEQARALRVREVANRLSLGEREVWLRVAQGEFPKPIRVGATHAWLEHQVEAWRAEQHAKRLALVVRSTKQSPLNPSLKLVALNKINDALQAVRSMWQEQVA